MKIKKQKQTGVGSNKESPFNNIDGDLVSFPVAAACDGKYYVIEGIEGKYAYIKYTEGKPETKSNVMDAFEKAGKKYDRKLVSEAYEPDADITHVLHSVRLMLESIIEGAGNGPFQIYLTGKGNFRYDVATIKPYKGNRDGVRRPFHLQNCRDYLIKRWGAIVVDGEEADDACGYSQTEDTILSSTDKDLNCIPGRHYRWPDRGKEGLLYTITPEEANRNFYKQLLVGDTTDNIQGVKGIGAKNPALKDIDGMTNPREMAEFTFNIYFEHEMGLHCDKDLISVKRLAYDKYLENGQLVWIRREEGEIWEPPKAKEN